MLSSGFLALSAGLLGLAREGSSVRGLFRLGSQSRILRFEKGQEMINPIICYKFIKAFGHFQLGKYGDL